MEPDQASLTVLQGPDRGAVHCLVPGRNRLGRDPLSEVRIHDEAASRAHAEVTWDAERGAWLVRDLASRNGTVLNGLPCLDGALAQGDELRIGATTLLFQLRPLDAPLRTGASTLVLAPARAGTVQAEDAGPRAAPPLVLELAPHMVGKSPAFARVLEQAARAARTDASVLVVGESGTGKELLAQALHRASERRGGPFVAVNAATLGDSLAASELFGHERGAFTGAVARRAGCLERADGGTLFLDELGELGLEAQAKLLRALETRRFTRLGGTDELASDFRLVAATNRDLEARVREGAFRQDLLFRVDVVRLRLPPLRERSGDVALLAERLLDELRGRMRVTARAIAPEALRALEAHDWPGNVRELRNVLERALIFAAGAEVGLEDLPATIAARGVTVAPTPQDRPVRTLVEVERDEVQRALLATAGNKTQAALLLGIDRKTLYAKMERHGLADLPTGEGTA